jgi:predicted Ser/Thr protein kinase
MTFTDLKCMWKYMDSESRYQSYVGMEVPNNFISQIPYFSKNKVIINYGRAQDPHRSITKEERFFKKQQTLIVFPILLEVQVIFFSQLRNY